MDPLSVLKNELFRPLTSIVVPAAVAISPYIFIAARHIPEVTPFWIQHPSTFGVTLFVIIVAIGLVLENLGSWIELFWDRRLEPDIDARALQWNQYLILRISDEYIGQRYLRTVLTRLKFELSMAPALAVFAVGLQFLEISVPVRNVVSICSIIIAALLVRDSYAGAVILKDVRAQLVEAERLRLAPALSPAPA